MTTDDIVLRARPGIGHDWIDEAGEVALHIPKAIAGDEAAARRVLDWFFPALESAERNARQRGRRRLATELRVRLGDLLTLVTIEADDRTDETALSPGPLEPLIAVSITHVSAETGRWIEARLAAERARVAGLAPCPTLGTTVYGYIVWLDDDWELLAALPEDLRATMAVARHRWPTAMWLLLDRDGPVLDGLARHAW